MVGTKPMVLPLDLMALDHFLIWFLSVIISGSLPAIIGNWGYGLCVPFSKSGISGSFGLGRFLKFCSERGGN